MFEELAEINELLVMLNKRRNEILDAIYPVEDNEEWMDQLAEAYSNVA